jgi:hypothetical protein
MGCSIPLDFLRKLGGLQVLHACYRDGTDSFSLPPDFVGGSAYACNQDYRLSPGSPCRNAGAFGVRWLNPDGTRCDMGAYGGPGAATFFTNPNDGPIIRNVTIDQGMVPKGSTFTIRATGAVR